MITAAYPGPDGKPRRAAVYEEILQAYSDAGEHGKAMMGALEQNGTGGTVTIARLNTRIKALVA